MGVGVGVIAGCVSGLRRVFTREQVVSTCPENGCMPMYNYYHIPPLVASLRARSTSSILYLYKQRNLTTSANNYNPKQSAPPIPDQVHDDAAPTTRASGEADTPGHATSDLSRTKPRRAGEGACERRPRQPARRNRHQPFPSRRRRRRRCCSCLCCCCTRPPAAAAPPCISVIRYAKNNKITTLDQCEGA